MIAFQRTHNLYKNNIKKVTAILVLIDKYCPKVPCQTERVWHAKYLTYKNHTEIQPYPYIAHTKTLVVKTLYYTCLESS